ADEHKEVAEERQTTESLVETLTHRLEETAGRIDGLRDSDAYIQGHELDQLRQRTGEVARRLATVEADAVTLRERATVAAAAAEVAEGLAAAGAQAVATGSDATHQAPTRAGLVSVHGEVATSLDVDPARSRPLLRAAVRGRTGQIAVVRQALA